ncbi:hypothetical protein [Cesiribacter sp. SM1]|uniref:hypothetical protein n=1 Tax=Cesiribacter sp. SM1 TaxID=2861196 RepID=UPI001CD36D93|nr:hypothetical protein [Cesiribacter sp. SM1]
MVKGKSFPVEENYKDQWYDKVVKGKFKATFEFPVRFIGKNRGFADYMMFRNKNLHSPKLFVDSLL